MACQGHLPELETSPRTNGPKVEEVVGHIECELARIVNYDPKTSDVPRLAERLAVNGKLEDWLAYLKTYHFVATAQLSMQVTDSEALSPSLAALNLAQTLAFAVGGQLTGTQDRSLTLNYAIDLSRLKIDESCKSFAISDGAQILRNNGFFGGIVNDLGLAGDRQSHVGRGLGTLAGMPPIATRAGPSRASTSPAWEGITAEPDHLAPPMDCSTHARKLGHHPLCARVRHTDKGNPDHWRSCS